jgi:primosomal protein N' (replication factor Y)
MLEREPQGQALVLVPEINLTPQLAGALRRTLRAAAVVPAQRHDQPAAPAQLAGGPPGQARIVLGTRMAFFASLPRCA